MVSRAKSKWYKQKKSQEIGINFTITDCSNFDERCSGVILCLSYFITTVTSGKFDIQKDYIDIQICTLGESKCIK